MGIKIEVMNRRVNRAYSFCTFMRDRFIEGITLRLARDLAAPGEALPP
jgi:hypothetical protein